MADLDEIGAGYSTLDPEDEERSSNASVDDETENFTAIDDFDDKLIREKKLEIKARHELIQTQLADEKLIAEETPDTNTVKQSEPTTSSDEDDEIDDDDSGNECHPTASTPDHQPVSVPLVSTPPVSFQ